MAPLEHPSPQDPRDITWCGANASSQQNQGLGIPALPERSVTISGCFPRPPENLTFCLSFILVPVSFKRDKLLGLKLMCLCDRSRLPKLTVAETDESNQFVNFRKGGLWKTETDYLFSRLIWNFNFSPTSKSFVFTPINFIGLYSGYNQTHSLNRWSIPSESNSVYCLAECYFTLSWLINLF